MMGHEAIVELARGISRGTVDVVAGCRELVRLLGALRMTDELAVPAETIRGFESETDAVPAGTARAHWEPHALAAQDREHEAYVARARSDIVAACDEIVRVLESGASQ